MKKNKDVVVVNDLVTKCMHRFLDAGYILNIYPDRIHKKYALVAVKFGIQGAHYEDVSIENCFIQLLGHMQEGDKELKEKNDG